MKQIQITFTKDQFRELLFDVMLGASIRSGIADRNGVNWKKYEEIQTYLLKMAFTAGFNDLVQIFENALLPSDELCQAEEKIMDEYNDDEFWYQLETRLGKRDFYRTMTEEEIIASERDEWFPERIHDFYATYEKEFEKFGIDRLEIVSNKI